MDTGLAPKDLSCGMRSRLAAWAVHPITDSKLLMDWLKGESLPASPDKPSVWLMRALPQGDEPRSRDLRTNIAEHIAPMISNLAQGKPWENTKEALGELLKFVAQLNRPQELGKPLQMLAFVIVDGKAHSDALDVRSVRQVILTALIENQYDELLKPLWIDYLNGGQDVHFLGNPYSGFDGLCKMPQNAESIGQPNIEAIVEGTQLLANYLEKGEPNEKHTRMAQRLQLVCDHYPKCSLRQQLSSAFSAQKLPSWAIDALPAK